MKKHLTQLLLSLLFLVVTAMTCDEQDLAEPIDISCTLKEVELYHWDNACLLYTSPSPRDCS